MNYGLLFAVPDETPAWKANATHLGIETERVVDGEDSFWRASVEWFGETLKQEGNTEQQAVTLLVYRIGI